MGLDFLKSINLTLQQHCLLTKTSGFKGNIVLAETGFY